jgi:hypothetical protein
MRRQGCEVGCADRSVLSHSFRVHRTGSRRLAREHADPALTAVSVSVHGDDVRTCGAILVTRHRGNPAAALRRCAEPAIWVGGRRVGHAATRVPQRATPVRAS